jgi:two-component system phosphate regulon sensor histidine kinase PhoR
MGLIPAAVLGLGGCLGALLWDRRRLRNKIKSLTRISRDLSENLHRQLGEIQKETAHLDNILSNMAEGVITLDKEGRLLSINPSAQVLFGVDPEASLGRPLLEVIRNVNLGDLARHALETAAARYQEIPSFLPEEKIFQAHAGPLVVNGEMQGALLVLHDITELKRLERLRRDFVANVSHELRTPLASIEGFAETLLGGALTDPVHGREFVETIQNQAQNLHRLIDDLLDLSAIESGKRPPEKRRIDPASIAREVVESLAPPARARSVRVTVEAADHGFVEADPQQLRQVFVNLIDNAIKFNRDGGGVEVAMTREDGRFLIKVADTGTGIPEQDLPRIFERFYRVDKARSRALGGTGLGLSIVKHIVEAHGGQITVTSAEGRGSTFQISLPLPS